jgi:Skp family chaperone for outer membrane proteins
MRYLFPLLFLTLFLASCAAPKPAPGAFESAERRIEAAVQAGAEQHSPVELRFAREKLAEARKGMEERYNQTEKSIYLIEQSEINSELAIEKSRTAETRARVAELARQNEILREDFEASFGEMLK